MTTPETPSPPAPSLEQLARHPKAFIKCLMVAKAALENDRKFVQKNGSEDDANLNHDGLCHIEYCLAAAPEALRQATQQPAVATEEGVGRELNVIGDAMRNDLQYAWGWHCNIAMAFVDEGGDYATANRAAARFLTMLFPGLDTTQHPQYAVSVKFKPAPDAAAQAGAAYPVNYDAPTPETDAFMTQIDDSEIDLGQVQSKLSDFENERNAARARIAELEVALLAVGDMAVADWNDAAVGAVDAVVKEPARYRDMLKSLFSAAKERDTLRASLAAVEKERDEAKEQHERDCLELIDERDKAQEAISHAFYLVLGHSPEWSNIFGLDQATEEIDLAQRALRAALAAAQERVKALEADGLVGEVIRMGTFEVAGDQISGVAIKCSEQDLQSINTSLLYKRVRIAARAQFSEEGRP